MLTKEMRKRRVYIYDHMRRGPGREDEHERRRDDIRLKTISSRRKEERHPGTERRKEGKM